MAVVGLVKHVKYSASEVLKTCTGFIYTETGACCLSISFTKQWPEYSLDKHIQCIFLLVPLKTGPMHTSWQMIYYPGVTLPDWKGEILLLKLTVDKNLILSWWLLILFGGAKLEQWNTNYYGCFITVSATRHLESESWNKSDRLMAKAVQPPV